MKEYCFISYISSHFSKKFCSVFKKVKSNQIIKSEVKNSHFCEKGFKNNSFLDLKVRNNQNPRNNVQK